MAFLAIKILFNQILSFKFILTSDLSNTTSEVFVGHFIQPVLPTRVTSQKITCSPTFLPKQSNKTIQIMSELGNKMIRNDNTTTYLTYNQ